jgi:hypothetical protein
VITRDLNGLSALEWPELALDEWEPTRTTLHMLTQIVGKVRIANTPLINHWWNAPLYLTARGLTTSPIPAGARVLQIDFDFIDHQLKFVCSDGRTASIALRSRPIAELYEDVTQTLRPFGADADIWTMPVEIPDAIPFDTDHTHGSYEPEHAARFWRQLIPIHRVLTAFRSRFVGKVSPVHIFWGALDLAVTRFSGRSAPPHPGGAPNVGRWVMVEAYSHEVSSAGYWPGGGGEGSFYSYAYPEPPGYASARVSPGAAAYSAEAGEFLLPYTEVRTAREPATVLLEFLESTYRAAADRAGWDHRALERPAE